MKLQADHVELVTVEGAGDRHALSFQADGTAALDAVPEGKQLQQSKAQSISRRLGALRFERVWSAADASVEDADPTVRVTLQARDGVIYSFSVATHQGDHVVADLAARATDESQVMTRPGVVESEEQLRKKEATLLAQQSAQRFTRRHRDWVYQLPAHQAHDLFVAKAELLEGRPAPEPQPAAPAEAPEADSSEAPAQPAD